MGDLDPLEQMVNLSAAAVGVDDVQLVVLGEPGLELRSGRSITSSTQWAHRSGYQNRDADFDDSVAPWVHSLAVVPITGPAGEAGFVIVGSEEVGKFDSATVEVLTRMVKLVESHLDRSAEQVRLDRLSEVLRTNQEELRSARDRLLVSNEELEQFAYIAAHELVAPLRAVSLYAEVLEPLVLADEIDHAQVTKCVEAIQVGVADMDQQVKQLLELSNIHGELSQIAPLDLTDVVDRARMTMSESFEAAGADIEVGELPKVMGRPVPLQSVFANLFSNALRYRHPARSLMVKVWAEQRADRAVVVVSDNGVGVDPKTKDRIFQMFERGSTETAGSGIGLALSRRIVEAVGGELSLSRSGESGAEFRISLQQPRPA